MSRYENHVYIPDLHAPYHDEAAFSTALAFVREFKPDHVWVLGDVCDFYALSRFDRRPDRALQLQSELDASVELLQRIRDAAPRARATLLKGNHEDRLRRFLWSKAGELAGLRSLDLVSLFELRRLRYDWVETGLTRVSDLVVKHGTMVRSRAGYTATGELDRAGLSGVSGHTHRLAYVVRRTMAGSVAWAEAGCLCQLDPDYMEGSTADWAHGLVYGHLEKGGNRFGLHLLPIVHGRVIYGGEEITVKAGRKRGAGS